MHQGAADRSMNYFPWPLGRGQLGIELSTAPILIVFDYFSKHGDRIFLSRSICVIYRAGLDIAKSNNMFAQFLAWEESKQFYHQSMLSSINLCKYCFLLVSSSNATGC